MKRMQTAPQTDQPIPATGVPLPSLDRIQQDLATATSLDDFFGKQYILTRLFASTSEQMLETKLTAHLGYQRYAPPHARRARAGMGSAHARCAPQLDRIERGDPRSLPTYPDPRSIATCFTRYARA